MAIAKTAAAILTAASLLVAPVAASAAPVARASAPVSDESNLSGGGSGGTILLVAVIAGMLYAAYELIDGDDNPTSP